MHHSLNYFYIVRVLAEKGLKLTGVNRENFKFKILFSKKSPPYMEVTN